MPLTALSAFFALGIAAGAVVKINLLPFVLIMCLFAASLIILRKGSLFVLLAASASGFLIVSVNIYLTEKTSIDEYVNYISSFTVKVSGMPERSGGRTYFDGEIIKVKTAGSTAEEIKMRASKARVTIEGRSNLKIAHGDILEIEAKLKKPQKVAYKGGFDYSLFLKRNGILYTAYASDFKVRRPAKSGFYGKDFV